ncbi:MAG: Histidine kinase [Thermodesulfobacteriota bacterium]|nr:Histidine kinase [Thermodesulfobacteriota bacterium]
MAKKPHYEELEQRIGELEQETIELKRTAAVLRQSEERYRTVLDSIEEAYFEVDLAGNFTFFNDSLCRMLGYSREELLGKNNREYMPPESSREILALFSQLYRTGKPVKKVVYEIIGKDGLRHFHELSASLMKDATGKPIGFRGISHDITDLKKAWDALRESEAKYRSILEGIEEGYYETDLAGNFTFFNDPMLKVGGYSSDEFMQTNFRSYSDEETIEKVHMVFNSVYVTGRSVRAFEWKIRRKDGSEGYIEASVSLMRNSTDEPIGFRGLVRDVTQRKAMDERLRESEERYRNIFNNSTDFVYVLDLKGNFTDVNQAAERVTGYKRDELLKMNFRDYSSPSAHQEILDAFHQIFDTGKPLQDFRLEVTVKDGIKKYFETSVGPLRKGGNIVGFQGSSRDITRSVEAERALRRSEAKYRMILESIEDGYYEVDLKGRFVFFNDALCSIYRYSRNELLGMSIGDLTDPETSRKGYEVFHAVFATGNPSKGFEWKGLQKDGSEIHLAASVSLVRDGDGQPIGFRGLVRDITESRRLQSQLQQARKTEAIATLAGGIAHQFNNALTPIIGNVGLLEMDYRQNENLMGCLKDMKSASRRMADLTRQLLAYARGGKYNATVMSLRDVILETLPLIEHTLNQGVRLEADLPEDVMAIDADSNQMQMVVSAVIANANEAMEGSGCIRISVRNIDPDPAFRKGCPGLGPGPHVCLCVADNGRGMDEETKEKIFDPFFTTHFIGRGLGMASVYGIVANHGGTIVVDSEVGKGTTVRIYLPAVISREIPQEIGQAVMGATVHLPRGDATILVIEDEADVMDLIRTALERLGYRVLEAATGGSAIEIARTFEAWIDLALLDIKLPDMTGAQVYPLIMDARPKLKVVVCSGYSIEGPAQEILKAGAEGFIQKPFSISKLAEKLNEVLQGKRPQETC